MVIILLIDACGAFIFSIDKKTKQKNLDKIKALLIAGTRTHIFCQSTTIKFNISFKTNRINPFLVFCYEFCSKKLA